MRRRPCDKRKQELCANAGSCGGAWWNLATCRGFDYAHDCCGTCAHYLEDGTRGGDWYDSHPGACSAIGDEDAASTLADYMPARWTDPPCLMFEGAAW